MPLQDLTTPPTAPQRSDDPETFTNRADAMVAWFATFVSEMQTLTAQLEATAALIEVAPAFADPTLKTIADSSLTAAANKAILFTGAATAALIDVSSVAQTLLAQSTQAAMRETGLGMSVNGSSLVSAADYAAMRALLDLEAGTDFLSPAAIAAAYQPLDSDLTSIAALATTAFGRGLLTETDAASLRTTLNVLAGATVSQSGNKGYIDIPYSGGTMRVNWGKTTRAANTSATDTLHGSYTTALVGGGQAETTATADSDASYCYLASTTTMQVVNGTDGSLTFQWWALGIV